MRMPRSRWSLGTRRAAFLAGGTTEVDLTRQDVLRPGLLVDINRLPPDGVEDLPGGERAIGIDDFFLLPGDTPDREHPLDHGELIIAIEVPSLPVACRSVYLKFRDRQSYEFALASVAAAIRVEDGTVAEVRLALG